MATQKTKIRIPNPERVFNRVYVPLITGKPETRKPLVVIEGGRGSGKSRSIAQKLVLHSLERIARIGLVRKVADTIRHSQYQEIKDVVQDWNLGAYFTFIESRLEIQVSNGSLFICKGLDKVEKMKSLANIDVVWIEEATELTQNDWDTFRFSIRGGESGEVKQKILSFNRQAGSWTEKSFFNADGTFRGAEGVYHLHTTFEHNRFLDDAFLNDINDLKRTDPELYKKVAEGQPIRLKGLIFTNWRVIDEMPERSRFDEVIHGMDFGMSDPTVLVMIGIKEKDLFIDELVYERDKTNQDLLELIPEVIEDQRDDIYADSEDPNRIEEIFQAGYNVKPAAKGPNSVIEGLMFLRGFTLHITARSANLRRDFENYRWKADKNGFEVTPEKPQHAFSHGPDAVRYAVFTHLLNPTFREGDAKEILISPSITSRIVGY